MQTILVVFHLFLAIGVIGLVLMQHGKGADAGAAFGSGSSGTVFGATGAANFLSRATAAIATLFFLTSLALGYFAMKSIETPGLMESEEATAPITPPASEVPIVPGQESESPVPSVAVETAQEEVPVVPAQAVESPVPGTETGVQEDVPKPGQ